MSRFKNPSDTLYLIDISSFIFRAYFAINRSLKSRQGEPTNAVYGVATMLNRLAEEAEPEYLAIAYDSKEPSFREELFSEYKANRSEPPQDLIPQFGRIEELIACFGMHSYRQAGVEADDLIATLTKKWCEAQPENRVVIVSGDKDLMQLVNDRVCVWDTLSDKVYGPAEVKEKFGVAPSQMRDYLGLVGDSSDNIPGVEGVGPKTATELLKEYGDIEGVLRAAQAGKIPGKKGEKIAAGVESARLSLKLVALQDDLRVVVERARLKYRFSISEQCLNLLKALDFNRLVEKWEAKYISGAAPLVRDFAPEAAGAKTEVSASGAPNMPHDERFRTISHEQDFKKLLEAIEKRGEFGFDLETTSLNPRQAEIVGFSICYDPAFACYIPVSHRGTSLPQLDAVHVLTSLKPFLENIKYKKIGQNLKYDWSVLMQHGITPDGIGADTMVAAYLLDPEERHNLKALAAKYLNYNVLTYEEVCGKGKDQLTFDLVPIELATRYSAEDAWIAVKLWEVLRPRLSQEGLMEVFWSLEIPLVGVLARMECSGVCIDVDWLRDLSRRFERALRELEGRIGAFTTGPVNLNSPKQLAELLFSQLKLPVQGKTKTGYSTDASVLEKLAPLHEVPRLLLEYREISKLKGTYVDPLPVLKDPKSGKIHASFHQTGTATGRLSSSEPNLQNIPIRSERGRLIRRAFVPSPGNVLLSADYSQIELRLLAHMSKDADLCASFQKEEDVHLRTASEIFGRDVKDITDEERSIAKAINFGLMYGKTAFGLSQELNISRREAQSVIDRYFERYAGVKQFLDNTIAETRNRGWTATLMGRKRNLPDINSKNAAVRTNAERMAMNTPLQGTAADLIKLAMINLDAEMRRRGLASRLIIQVHDELVMDCPKAEIDEVRALLIRVMEGAMKFSVPLRVNVSVGDNWMEL